MQQSAYEHAALIWTRPSNTIRALRHVERRIMRPDTCQHPMTRQDQLQKSLLRLGRLHMLQNSPLMQGYPLPPLTSCHAFDLGGAARVEAVHERDTDVNFGCLSIRAS